MLRDLLFYGIAVVGGLAMGLAFWWNARVENQRLAHKLHKSKKREQVLEARIQLAQNQIATADDYEAAEKRRADKLDQELKQLLVEVEHLQKAKAELLGHLRRKKGPKKAARIAQKLGGG